MRTAAVLSAVVLLVAVIRSGSAYFFCPPMQRAMLNECCHPDELVKDDSGRALAGISQLCCEERLTGSLDEGLTARPITVPAAAFVAIVDDPWATFAAHRVLAREARDPNLNGPTGPPRRSPREYRLLLQVFLS